MIHPDAQWANVYLESLAAGPSRSTTESALRVVTRDFFGCEPDEMPWTELRASEVGRLRAQLAEHRSPATANKLLAAVRGVVRAAWRGEAIDTDTCLRNIDAAKTVKGSRLPAGRALTSDETQRLLAACDDGTPSGPRDDAAFALMLGCGLRCGELIAVNMADVDIGGETIRVLGKGNKERSAYLYGGPLRAVTRWVVVRGDVDGPLLCPVLHSGRLVAGRGISTAAVTQRLAKRCREAGIDRCTPHDLRRTFVTCALEAGLDLLMVQRLAGHSSPATTATYDRRRESATRQAAQKLIFPAGDPKWET
ncbi:MAG: site-specific integrase [Acidimicrobiaceae bacterium]|nr:site-specific integrase [Acidimicrobiia bacterium]MCY4493615.1 site-specific integrase [Acidimicrobiaceae bacterium]